jgi:hypothetical protein
MLVASRCILLSLFGQFAIGSSLSAQIIATVDTYASPGHGSSRVHSATLAGLSLGFATEGPTERVDVFKMRLLSLQETTHSHNAGGQAWLYSVQLTNASTDKQTIPIGSDEDSAIDNCSNAPVISAAFILSSTDLEVHISTSANLFGCDKWKGSVVRLAPSESVVVKGIAETSSSQPISNFLPSLMIDTNTYTAEDGYLQKKQTNLIFESYPQITIDIN